jgi:hypothetical protein
MIKQLENRPAIRIDVNELLKYGELTMINDPTKKFNLRILVFNVPRVTSELVYTKIGYVKKCGIGLFYTMNKGARASVAICSIVLWVNVFYFNMKILIKNAFLYRKMKNGS